MEKAQLKGEKCNATFKTREKKKWEGGRIPPAGGGRVGSQAKKEPLKQTFGNSSGEFTATAMTGGLCSNPTKEKSLKRGLSGQHETIVGRQLEKGGSRRGSKRLAESQVPHEIIFNRVIQKQSP